MFGFSAADWIFIALVMGVIFGCVAISDMVKKPGDE
jgi:Sec-independent protein translocase protein TatA